VHTNNTELAVEYNKEIVRRFSVPTTIPTIRSALEELGGRCHLTFEDGPMAGRLITIEPGVYMLGLLGVRIEDDVLVTKTGCKVLSQRSATSK
jgi:hypothetical protein